MAEVKRTVCSTVAYLIGAQKKNFFAESGADGLLRNVFEKLDRIPAAQIVRDLCILRYRMLRNSDRLRRAFEEESRNIFTLEKVRTATGEEFDILPMESIMRLHSNGVEIFMNRPNLYAYLMNLNNLLSRQLDRPEVGRLFPPEITWRYIREMILFPSGTNERNVLPRTNDYLFRHKSYPYGCYINWNMCEGNILVEDNRFLRQLYERNKDCWYGEEEGDTRALSIFLSGKESAVAVVDCATTDLASLQAFREEAGDRYAGCIGRVLLLCPAVMKDSWQPMAESQQAELHEVEGTCLPGSEEWRNMLADLISEEVFAENGPLILATGDTELFRNLYDGGILDGRYLIVTGRSRGPEWNKEGQQEHLCFLPQIHTDYARKSALALERVRARLAACRLPGVTELVTQALRETPYAFTQEEQQRMLDLCTRGLTLVVGRDGELTVRLG